LIHPGPDSKRISIKPFLDGRGRLKIIDLAPGTADFLRRRGFRNRFNGEIYIISKYGLMEKLGHRFESHSDTETVFARS